MKVKVEDHPLTPFLRDANGYVGKQYVRKINGYFHYLRPFWRATWGMWCVRDGGPQEIIRTDHGEYEVR